MKVLFKEFITVWTRGLVSWLSRKFDSISIDLTPVEEKIGEQFVHSLIHTRNDYMAADSQINRIVVRFGSDDFRNYDLVGIEVVDGITFYKWATVNTMPIGYVYTDKWKGLSRPGGDAVYVKEGDTMVRLKDQYGNNINTWQAQSFKNATTSDIGEAKQEMRNVAGSCIIPDFELPCLPFERQNGQSGLENDGEAYIGDFMPQVGSIASRLFVGSVIKVTGDNATEDEFAGFPIDSYMSVAHTVSEEEAGYEQGLYGTLSEGDPIYGVTSMIVWEKDHYYRVTGFHDIYDMTNHEVVEGLVITYEEVDPATITDMGKKIVEKLDGLDVHDENAKHLAQFFGLPEALPGSYVPASTQQILTELENIWQEVTGETAPLESFVCNNFRREVHNGVVSYHDVDENVLG